jgi:nucleoside 2-deoxyribosyltransferase
MTIYVAAPYPLREQARRARLFLQARGHEVTSRWIIEDQAEMSDEHARGDLEDVARADVLLALHPEGWHNLGTGGRHVELGYALALGKRCVLIGQPTNNFHHLDVIEVFDTLEDFVRTL